MSALDNTGRCPHCHKKPLTYKRKGHFFCRGCCRCYSIVTGQQVESWLWRFDPAANEFVERSSEELLG